MDPFDKDEFHRIHRFFQEDYLGCEFYLHEQLIALIEARIMANFKINIFHYFSATFDVFFEHSSGKLTWLCVASKEDELILTMLLVHSEWIADLGEGGIGTNSFWWETN